MQQNGDEQGIRRIFLEMPNGSCIELLVVEELKIQDLKESITQEEDYSQHKMLKIFEDDQLLRSQQIFKYEDLKEGQIFKAQTIKKLQPIFFKTTYSEPKEIIVDVEKQRIVDVVEVIKRELGIPEWKKIRARWNNKFLDQDRYFYEYQRIQYDQIILVENEIPNGQVPNPEENQEIELTIQHQGDIFQKSFQLYSTIEEVCLDVKKKLDTSEMLNLYQNNRKLDKNSKLSDFLNINQYPLIASIQRKYFTLDVNYQGVELQVKFDSQTYIQEVQDDIRSLSNIPQNIIFALYLNDIKLDSKLRLDEYSIDDKQKIRVKIEPSSYIIMLPEFQMEVPIEIEDFNITINDIVLFIKEKQKILDTKFSAYQGKDRLNLNININQVHLKSNIITLWQDQQIQQNQEKQVLITCKIIDLGKIYQIQISQNKNIKSLETIIKDKFKINENIMFYHNKIQICSNQTLKELEITEQIKLDCLILKQSYVIQVRYQGVIKKFDVKNNTIVSEIKERARLEFEVNQNVNLKIIHQQTIFIDDYRLDNYLIDQIIDIIPFEFNLNLLIYGNNGTTRINLIMNYQNKILDLCQKLNRVCRGIEFNVYCDRLKQKKKKYLRELNYNNLIACEIKRSLKFDVQIQDLQKMTVLTKQVDNKQIIRDFLIELFKNINFEYLKELKLTFQNLILDQKKKFSSYLIQENDIVEIMPPSLIYQFEINGSQLDCQLVQEKLRFYIRIFDKTTQITASPSTKLSNIIYKLKFNNLNIKNIYVQCKNKILDINQTLRMLGIKYNDVLEVVENKILFINIQINKWSTKLMKINSLWNLQQLKDFVSQQEDVNLEKCIVQFKNQEIQENIQLTQLQLNDYDLIEIFYKQKPQLQSIVSCTQLNKKSIYELDKPQKTVPKIQQKYRNINGCQCNSRSACRCKKNQTIFTKR